MSKRSVHEIVSVGHLIEQDNIDVQEPVYR